MIRMAKSHKPSAKRRQLIKGMAALSGGGILAGCLGDNTSETPSNKDSSAGGDNSDTTTNTTEGNDLKLRTAALNFAFPAEDPLGKSFEEEYNVDLSQDSIAPGPDEIVQMFVAGDGQGYDALHDSNSIEDLLASEGLISPIDKSEIDNWDNMQESLKEGGAAAQKLRHNGDLYSSPVTQNADSIAYNKDEMDEPNSWGVLFDEQFQGKTAVIDDWANTLCWTALYLRENNMADIDNPSNMEPDEVEAVIDFLIENKKAGQFKTIWKSYGNLVNLLVNEELVASYSFLTAWQEANNKGANLGYPALKEGHYEWNDNWHMTNGCVDRGRQEAWYRLAEYSLTPEFAADLLATRATHTGLKFEKAENYIQNNSDDYDVDRLMDLFEATSERYAANGDTYAWNNMNPDHRTAYTDGWSRFLNA